MEYHVLSNGDIISILRNVAVLTFFMWPLFSYLASRDASNINMKKGLAQKIIPWVLLCVFLSDIALLVSRLYDYPWDIDAIPSQASAYREMQYLPTGFVLYGWANDYLYLEQFFGFGGQSMHSISNLLTPHGGRRRVK